MASAYGVIGLPGPPCTISTTGLAQLLPLIVTHCSIPPINTNFSSWISWATLDPGLVSHRVLAGRAICAASASMQPKLAERMATTATHRLIKRLTLTVREGKVERFMLLAWLSLKVKPVWPQTVLEAPQFMICPLRRPLVGVPNDRLGPRNVVLLIF